MCTPQAGEEMLYSRAATCSQQGQGVIHMPDWVWVLSVLVPLGLFVFVAERRAGHGSRGRGARRTRNYSAPHHIATIVVENAGSASNEADTISGIGAVSSSGFGGAGVG